MTTAAAEPALDVRDLSLAFRTRRGPLPVLAGLSLTVGRGEFVSLVGPSGSGKSTLFHVIGGLLRPDSGTVHIGGQDVTGERGHIGYVPQQGALLPWRTVEDNVLLAREIAGKSRRGPVARELARSWLERIGVGGFEKAYPHALSGGMQQRVAFVRALLGGRDLLCLDEPFSALDAMTRAEMQQWLLETWADTGRSVLFVTHNIEEALLLSSVVYVVSQRPARILLRVDVPFARPRPSEIIDDPRFVALRRTITNRLRKPDPAPSIPPAPQPEVSLP